MEPTTPEVTAESEQDQLAGDGLHKAANGAASTVTDAEERGALEFLLGPTVTLRYKLTVQYETPEGMRPLTFHFHQLDPDEFERIDAEHRSGDGPFAKLNVPMYNAGVVAEATDYLTDGAGNRIDLDSEEWRGGVPTDVDAMRIRFKKQGGLLENIVTEVRRVSGYSPDRIGSATRELAQARRTITDAVGG